MSYVVYADLMLVWIFLINYVTYHITCNILNHRLSQIKLLLWCVLTSLVLELFYIYGIYGNGQLFNVLYICLYIFLMIIFLRFVLKLRTIQSFIQLLIYNIFGTLLLSGIIQIFINNNLSLRIILPVFTIIFLAVPIIHKIFPTSRENNKSLTEVIIITHNHTLHTIGYMDTGNTLKDIYSGNPVIILEYSLLQDLLSQSEYDLACQYIKTGNYTFVSRLKIDGEKIYPIPYKTISNDSAIMAAFKIKCLIINNNKIYKNIVAGISPHSFAKGSEYKVLLNNNL